MVLANNRSLQVLVMVPSTALKNQWIKVLTKALSNISIGSDQCNQVFVTTYAYMCMNYFKMRLHICVKTKSEKFKSRKRI